MLWDYLAQLVFKNLYMLCKRYSCIHNANDEHPVGRFDRNSIFLIQLSVIITETSSRMIDQSHNYFPMFNH